jgi:hypothetical protein
MPVARKKLFAAAAIVILLLAGVGFVLVRQGQPPASPGNRGSGKYPVPPPNTPVADKPDQTTEPSIAVSGKDNATIVVGANDLNTPTGIVWCGHYVTHDGGKSWKQGLIGGYPQGPRNALTGFRDTCDSNIVSDSKGNFYYVGVAYNRVPPPTIPSKNRTMLGPSAVFFAKSTDNGDTFGSVVLARPTALTHVQFNDKPVVAVDDNTGDLYIVWSSFHIGAVVGGCQLMVIRSTDGGASWSSPVTVTGSFTTGDNWGVSIVVDQNSTVHLGWPDASMSAIRYSRSTDHGATFSAPVDIASIVYQPTPLPPTHFRTPMETQMAVDRGTTKTGGSLYLTWADYASGDTDVYLAASHDGGQSWGDPVRVNNDTVGNGIDQFFPAVTVTDEGWVHVGFYDRRSDPDNKLLEYWWAISFDGGGSFPLNMPMSNVSFDGDLSQEGDLAFIGDYTGMSSGNGTVAGVWCDTRRATDSAPQSDIYGAVVPYKELLRTNKFTNVTIPWPK